jgi:L-alanine-DL-glutamate epimerase-like enolase superfamily enzyme
MIKWRCFDLEAQLYGGALAPDRGRISVPQGFGLGLEPERDVIRAYAMV